MRVCIDARLGSGLSGGVEQVVIGLASALSDGDCGDEYLFMSHPESDSWLRPYLGGPCRLIHSRLEYPGQPGLAAWKRRLRGLLGRSHHIPTSDGVAEAHGSDLVHFTFQEAFLTELPSIYQPHDLQHLHLPDLFSASEVRRREVVYRTHCERAAQVLVMTSWGKRDLIDKYGLPEEKVAVVPWGSVLEHYPEPVPEELEKVRSRLALPDRFLLYPAQTWPHKNHLRLLDAVALLRSRGVRVHLVCPGQQNHHYPAITEHQRRLGLEDAVRFPGFVTTIDLRALYALADGVVFPSLFEGWGLPVNEAFSAGIPVASSSAASLPDLVGDAGLLFDPIDPDAIATQMHRLWSDGELRRKLAERGRRRAELFTFDRSARLLRAHYRDVAGNRLSQEQALLLAESPPV